MKRIFDIFFSFSGLIMTSPLIITILFFVWLEDKKSPLYLSNRIGKRGKEFKMIKIRTMIVGADANNVDSTSSDDVRITKIGYLCRKIKVDELPQLFNILIGEMSFVGPRPNIKREIDIYTREELDLISIKPGLTDFASIVFSDESEILTGKDDPNLAYNQLIRPGKSKLGLFYVKNNNLLIDFSLILITLVSVFSRRLSLKLVVKLLKILKAGYVLVKIASRIEPLYPSPPPGSNIVVQNRNVF